MWMIPIFFLRCSCCIGTELFEEFLLCLSLYSLFREIKVVQKILHFVKFQGWKYDLSFGEKYIFQFWKNVQIRFWKDHFKNYV